MTDAANPGANPPAGAPPAGTPPAGGAPPGPAPQTRPEFIPETYWDPQAGLKSEFGTHYTELANFHKSETEKAAALKARKPEDIKLELKLPDTVKVPDGVKVQIDEKDPRIPILRDLALQNGWSQETVNAIVALDAQSKILSHNSEVERIAAEDKKLGDNGKARKDAVQSWAKGMLDKKEIDQGEYEEIRLTAATAAGVTLLEKIIAKASGQVPGTGGNPPAPPKPQDQPIEQRWYGEQKG